MKRFGRIFRHGKKSLRTGAHDAAYVLSHAAASDLRDIVRYTKKQWGSDQVVSYVARLQRGIEQLAASSAVGKGLSDIFPGLRVLHCEHHFFFCLSRDHAPALVVAILHERMVKLLAELKRRNVIRMAGLYLVGAWLIVQVASTVFPAFELPSWALRGVILLLVIGFIPALIFFLGI